MAIRPQSCSRRSETTGRVGQLGRDAQKGVGRSSARPHARGARCAAKALPRAPSASRDRGSARRFPRASGVGCADSTPASARLCASARSSDDRSRARSHLGAAYRKAGCASLSRAPPVGGQTASVCPRVDRGARPAAFAHPTKKPECTAKIRAARAIRNP
jgi:hypothetical protein